MMARVQTLLAVLVLLGAGVLLGSFLIQWRGRTLEVPAQRVVRGIPVSVPRELSSERVSVEVLNGSGEKGAAAAVTEALRDAGFDVKTFGNAPSFEYDSTVVLDRSGRQNAARNVAGALGLSDFRSEPRPDLYLDATIILGRDWRARLADVP